jgi:excisionase family DNA binding protein
MQFDVSAQNQSIAGGGKPQGSLEAETLLTVQEVAALLKVPASWVYEHARARGKKRLPHLKLGKYLRFRTQDILEWLDTWKI